MSWRPQIARLDTRNGAQIPAEIEFLASEHFETKRVGITLDASFFTADANGNKIVRKGTVLGRVTATGHYGPYQKTTSSVQTVTITGSPTGGTFTLTFASQTTAALRYDATPDEVKLALEALSSIGVGNVDVQSPNGDVINYSEYVGDPSQFTPVFTETGAVGGPYVVTFAGTLAEAAQTAITASGAGLTGGSSPGVSIAQTVVGGASGASDGRENPVGFLMETVNLRFGNVVTGLVIRGSVIASRCPGLDADAITALRAFTFQ